MKFKHDWTRKLPENCIVKSIDLEGENVVFGLYCVDKEIDIAVNILNGKVNLREQREPGIKGSLTKGLDTTMVTCYRGLNNKLWTKATRGLATRFICENDLCILAVLQKDYTLDVSFLDKNGETVDTAKFSKVYDYQLASSQDIIALTTMGFTSEDSHTMLIDTSTMSIIEEMEGFGGFAQSTKHHVLIYGFKETQLYTKIFDKRGDEVLEIEGQPMVPPYNPVPQFTQDGFKFEPKAVPIVDKHVVKLVSLTDYSIFNVFIKLPFTRGVFDVDLVENTLITMNNIMSKPVLIKHDVRGGIDWVSHIVREVVYLVSSRSIVALNTRMFNGETRIYYVQGRHLAHLESFSGNVKPVLAYGDAVILTDNKLVSRYAVE